MLKRTPFYDFHVSAGAKMVEYAGWEMPLLYRGVIDEHQQTRNSGSLFDVSHMGRLFFTGNVLTIGEEGRMLLLAVRAVASEKAKGGLWSKLAGGGKGEFRLGVEIGSQLGGGLVALIDFG